MNGSRRSRSRRMGSGSRQDRLGRVFAGWPATRVGVARYDSEDLGSADGRVPGDACVWKLTHLRFDPSRPILYTYRGAFLIPSTSSALPSTRQYAFRSALDLELIPSSPPIPKGVSYGLEPGNSWITCNGEKVLWLPSEFRPVRSAVSGSAIAIGCHSGRNAGSQPSSSSSSPSERSTGPAAPDIAAITMQAH
jgi:hypothetical protein